MRARRVGRLLGCAAIALLLAGCFKVNMDLEVAADNTVSGTAIIAVDESLLQLTGQNVDALFADMDLSDLPPGSTAEEYREDGFVGQEITFADMPLDAFTGNNALSGSGTGEELNIVREGDEFRVTGGFDMSGEEFTSTEIPEQFMDSFEFRISITFPGEVKSATGDIDGNTVTWEPTFGENTRVEAVASAIPSSSSPSPHDRVDRGCHPRDRCGGLLPHPPQDAGDGVGADGVRSVPDRWSPVDVDGGTRSGSAGRTAADGRSGGTHSLAAGGRGATTAAAAERALNEMPTYEYRCGSCGVTFESRRTIAHADVPISCPEGHDDSVRQLSVFAVTDDCKLRKRFATCSDGLRARLRLRFLTAQPSRRVRAEALASRCREDTLTEPIFL